MPLVARAFVGFIVAGGLGWICIGSWLAAAVMAVLGAFYAMGDPVPSRSSARELHREHYRDM